MSVFDSFVRKHDFLVCVDSDGCAMDTMNCKHFHCFGPCMVEQWELTEWKEEINLFQMTRGINRFKGLAMALGEINEKYTPIAGVEALRDWADHALTLSNDSVVEAMEAAKDEDARKIFEKALAWSLAVNESINRLPEDLKIPFPGAKAGLEAAHQFADVAVVSSANREEWGKYGLLDAADIVLAQDCGSKSHCIDWMLGFGYRKDHVLMVGDAPGDCAAAEKNGVWYYPILVNWEEESWKEFVETALPLFLEGKYGNVQAEKKQIFRENLGG